MEMLSSSFQDKETDVSTWCYNMHKLHHNIHNFISPFMSHVCHCMVCIYHFACAVEGRKPLIKRHAPLAGSKVIAKADKVSPSREAESTGMLYL